MKDRFVFIAVALESIDLIQSYIEGYDLTGFLADRKTQDAVIRNLEIIGQVLKDFGIETLSVEQPNMPWREITGMRNVLAHQYLGVDVVMVWETVQIHLDTLQ
ncbi:HepT-like ribonuclease domain-containing protein [Methylobacter sp.]|uniref:HepT-like ribonuclease domain-containing protein n=1 Tax=Methylobacter sp. TaxID=2051955 RepID=UPI002FDCC9E9